ncbi:MAG: CPBP family intramembrane glutamic endopeptidase [Candidatus Saccharimonadales bacterium]|nr:CPBP family intramembrane glutamic endopeptidase [Candidatus Saccharimonadales bacterium]
MATKKEPLPSEAAALSKKTQSFSWPWGIGSTVLMALLIYLLPQVIIGLSLTEGVREELVNGDNTGLNFAVLLAGESITLAVLYKVLSNKGKRLKDIFVNRPRLKDLAMSIPAFGIYVLATILALSVATFFINETTLEEEQVTGFEAAASNLEQFLVFIGLVLVVPFIEELLFRGFVFKGFLSRMPWIWAAIFSSALFGLAHLQINVAIDTFALGMVAAWLVYRTRNIWPAILLHAAKNAIAFGVLYNYIDF